MSPWVEREISCSHSLPTVKFGSVRLRWSRERGFLLPGQRVLFGRIIGCNQLGSTDELRGCHALARCYQSTIIYNAIVLAHVVAVSVHRTVAEDKAPVRDGCGCLSKGLAWKRRLPFTGVIKRVY